MPLGIYISVPFCRTKCSYCNFASDVFSKSAYENYVRKVIEDIACSRASAAEVGGRLDAGGRLDLGGTFGVGETLQVTGTFDDKVDSVYLGGGTPSILEASQLLRIFGSVREQFAVTPDAEITVECAPGTLTDSLIETLLRAGVNRVSLGVQSFVDREAQSVGRLHTRSTVIDEVARLRRSGLPNINIDLIAGLPHQTAESWTFSLNELIAMGAPHASVYMLEVDEDSRLGRELIAGGTRYHAHFVPDEAATADFYVQACETLHSAGIAQYEISNFARSVGHVVDSSRRGAVGTEWRREGATTAGEDAGAAGLGWESRHNLKYWTRQPYLGFGVDAHSMLPAARDFATCEALRFATPDSLDAYMNRAPFAVTAVSRRAAIEETFFLGLRLNRGVDLDRLRARFGNDAIAYDSVIAECLRDGLLEKRQSVISLTTRGRLLSNEVFGRFLLYEAPSPEISAPCQ
ncbi:MAG: coproporphyrinogen-III oxidase family protein [Terriglobales bacterium]